MKKFRIISSLAALVLALGMYSCDNEDGVDPGLDDEALIAAIVNATNKVEVSASELPGNSLSVIETEFSESVMTSVALAPELGFAVTVIRERGVNVGEVSSAFFDTSGRELSSDRSERSRRRRRQARDCFDFVFPISLTVPDGTSITLEDAGDWTEVREWYQANPEADERPQFNFPLDITFGDSLITINDNMELRRARGACEVDRADGRCFRLVFPITFVMADDSEIVLESREDWVLIREWYAANPDTEDRPDLVYPVQITFEDGSTVTVNSDEEMLRARETCED